jgi:hypothetical protein
VKIYVRKTAVACSNKWRAFSGRGRSSSDARHLAHSSVYIIQLLTGLDFDGLHNMRSLSEMCLKSDDILLNVGCRNLKFHTNFLYEFSSLKLAFLQHGEGCLQTMFSRLDLFIYLPAYV